MALALLALAAGAQGCGTSTGLQNGSILVRVTTTYYAGGTPVAGPTSPSPYTAYVQDVGVSGNWNEQPIDPNGTASFGNLGLGFDLEVGLTDLPTGCMTAVSPKNTLLREGNSHQEVAFRVRCDLPDTSPEPAVIQGTVTDTAGVAVDGALVTALLGGVGVETDLTEGGFFTMEVADPGAYAVTAVGKTGLIAFAGVDSVDALGGQTSTVDLSVRDMHTLALASPLGDLNAAAGSTVTLPGLDWQVWSREGCPLCSHTIVVGLDGTPEATLLLSVPGLYPGASGTEAFQLTAPSIPGTYTIWAVRFAARTDDALALYTERFPSQSRIDTEFLEIGTLTVQTPARHRPFRRLRGRVRRLDGECQHQWDGLDERGVSRLGGKRRRDLPGDDTYPDGSRQPGGGPYLCRCDRRSRVGGWHGDLRGDGPFHRAAHRLIAGVSRSRCRRWGLDRAERNSLPSRGERLHEHDLGGVRLRRPDGGRLHPGGSGSLSRRRVGIDLRLFTLQHQQLGRCATERARRRPVERDARPSASRGVRLEFLELGAHTATAVSPLVTESVTGTPRLRRVRGGSLPRQTKETRGSKGAPGHGGGDWNGR